MASWMKARVNENGESFGKVLEVLGKTPVSAEPGESALDHPSTGQDDETLDLVGSFDDLRPRAIRYGRTVAENPLKIVRSLISFGSLGQAAGPPGRRKILKRCDRKAQ
jgi:hypothetical protein